MRKSFIALFVGIIDTGLGWLQGGLMLKLLSRL